MHTLPPKMIQALDAFALLLSKGVFKHAWFLLVGALPQLRVE
jgi:dipeptide/tripeptide permease